MSHNSLLFWALHSKTNNAKGIMTELFPMSAAAQSEAEN
jgi:hypothetical protein